MAQLLGTTENGKERAEDQEPASKDKDVSDLDQLLKSERQREKEEMELPPLVVSRGFCHGLVCGCLYISFSNFATLSRCTIHVWYTYSYFSSYVGRRRH